MKKHIRLLSVLSLSLVLSAPFLSVAQNVRKTKLINRSYTVTAQDKLQIDNSFGDVTINTWDQQTITVDVEIGSHASSDVVGEAVVA